MGATVTTGKEVYAIQGVGGPVYILFEETYEKNCHPHRPRWSTVGLGYIEATLQQIFRCAASCEGGMLQGRGGQITPEGYIAGWLKELAAPRVYPDVMVEMKAGDGVHDFLTAAELSNAKNELAANGAAMAILSDLEARGEIDVRLHKNIDAIAAIIKVSGKQPWRFIRHRYPDAEIDCQLMYDPKKRSGVSIEQPEAMRVGNLEDTLLKDENGFWRSAGWAYSIVGEFIRDQWQTELKEPGSYRRRIKAYRDVVNNAPKAEFPLRMRLDKSDLLGLQSWEARSLRKFLDANPEIDSQDGIAVTDENAWGSLHLPYSSTVWDVSQASAPAPGQLSLV